LNIIVDSNEPSDFVEQLKIMGVPVEVSKLEISDYVCGEFIIERKDSRDFLNSIFDGRLFRQMNEMNNDLDHKPLLIVYGNLPPRQKWIKINNRVVRKVISKDELMRREQTIISTISTIVNSYSRVSVITLKDKNQFITFLSDLYYRQTSHESKKPAIKRKANNIDDYKWNIFSQLPGIGSSGCKILLEKKISIHQLSEMTPEEIKNNFRNVGESRSKLIYEILNS